MNRDDENWFAALAGKPNPGTAPATLQEASALRAALLEKYADNSQEAANVIDINSAQMLRERLRSEGLIPTTQSKFNTKRTVTASLAASICICAGLSLTLQGHNDVTQSGMVNAYRGGEEAASIFVTDPRIAAQQVEQKLSVLNIRSQIQCESSHCTIEAYIPSAQEDAVNALMKSDQQSVGPNGQLLLRFRNQGK